MDRAEFDQFADEYHAQHVTNIAVTGESPEYFAEYKIAVLSSIFKQAGTLPQSILDFGSGIGASVTFFRKYFSSSRLTCSDASSRSLELSSERLPGNETYLVVDGHEIPAGASSYDMLFSACVFHHIDHAEHHRWLTELRRVALPGATLAIFEHNPFNPLTVRAVNTCPFDANARLITAGSLANRIRKAGWTAVRVRYHIFFPRALAFLRPLERWMTWLPLGGQYSVLARNVY